MKMSLTSFTQNHSDSCLLFTGILASYCSLANMNALSFIKTSKQDGSFSSLPSMHQQAGPAVMDASDMHVEGSGESLPDASGRMSPEMGKRLREPGDATV